MSVSTVSYYRNKENIPVQRPVKHKKNIFSDSKLRLIARKIITGKYKTVKEIITDLKQEGYSIDYKNLCKNFHNTGFVLKKYMLTTEDKKRRLKFAMEHRHWTIDDWKKVIFTDETQIPMFGSGGYQFIWVRPNNRISPFHIIPQVFKQGGSIMIWGCVTHLGIVMST